MQQSSTNPPVKPGFEERDVDVVALWRPALGLFVVVVVSFVLMYWMLQLMEWNSAKTAVQPSAIARKAQGQPPPEPRLQMNPSRDLREMLAAEEKTLRTYGWVDRSRGIARIPVERAIDLVAERGLPTRKEGGQ